MAALRHQDGVGTLLASSVCRTVSTTNNLVTGYSRRNALMYYINISGLQAKSTNCVLATDGDGHYLKTITLSLHHTCHHALCIQISRLDSYLNQED